MDAREIEGGCLCGAVRFVVKTPTLWCAHCHCSMCRRAHGAAFVTWFGVLADQFRITEGEAQLARHASSPEATRSFCRVCGSTMLFTSSRWAGEVHVALACVDGPIDRAPQAHVFDDARVGWLAGFDALPRRPAPAGE